MYESELLYKYGVSRQWLQQLRKGYSSRGYDYAPEFVFEKDYKYDADGARIYTPSGIRKIEARLKNREN